MGEKFFGITDPGRERENNEDSFIAQTVFNGDCVLACVIDGVGGYTGGELAAKITKEAILKLVKKDGKNITSSMVTAFEYANERIFKEKESSKQHEQMACVATLAIVDPGNNKLHYAHVGDTRLYLFRDNSLVKITHDHSSVGFLEESGRLTEAAAMAHPRRNEVNKALGYEISISQQKDFVETGESPFLPGDMILLCSDGLTDMITTAAISSILSSANTIKVKARLLVDAANEAGGKDNVTVVLVHHDKAPMTMQATRPVAAGNKTAGDSQTLSAEKGKDSFKTIFKEKIITKKQPVNTWLLLLLLLALAGLGWYYFKDQQKPPQPKVLMPPPAKKERSAEEKALADSLATHTALELQGAASITVSDSIFIKNDSLHFNGKGLVLKADSAYKGPAFVLSNNCKYILLDSITLENFDIGILVQQKGLHLKNVQFKNCKVPVQLQVQLPEQVAYAAMKPGDIFTTTDSLHTTRNNK